jgi:hypothetical protein
MPAFSVSPPAVFPKRKKRLHNIVYVRHSAHMHKDKAETPETVKQWFQEAIRHLWPVAEGSLSFRKTPCIRENCPACASGKGHRSYILYVRRGNERISLYVPEDLAPEIEKALENGRELQVLMNEAGLRYLHASKRERRRKAETK